LMSEADYDLGLLDNLHNILISLKGFGFGRLQNDFADRVRHAILHKNKENLGAAVLLCRSSMAKQEHKKALVLCREFLRRFPGSTHMQSLAALLYYRLHMEDQALSYCNKVLDENNQRAEMLLLKARIVWRSDREKGLAIIKNYLKESAEELVKAAAAEKGLSLPSRPEKSFWKKYRDRIIRPEESRKTYLDTIMAPDFLIGSEREDIFPVVYQYYSRYRWQQQFTEEAYARQAVMRGRYFRAAYHFSNLLAYQKSTDTSLLFDLAQVYGKLRRLEDEALFYKQIKRIDPDFPGLSEQIKRNQLQLSPRFALTYRYRQEEGWDGYKAMKRNEGEASSRFVFSPREQLEISAADIRYDPVGEEGDSLSAKRLFLSSKGSFFSKAAFKLGAGVEFLNHDNSSTGLLLCQIDRKFADDFVVGLSYERDVVTDTYASLTRNVVADNCRASISWDIYPFFSAGGDYGLISYSDSNEVDEYSFWTKYHVFGKPSYLTLTYQYSFRDAEEPEIKSGPMLPDGFRVDDHPYWAPQDYWENSFSLNWQQSISRFFMEHDSPSYYCASYTIDYDERGQVRQTVEGGIYLEWGHHLIGRSSIKYSASENYDVREFLLKAIYRW
ncbi:MAG: tetratricopeptide repeat protein, partial [Thermodesulfobacteriota bacterium]